MRDILWKMQPRSHNIASRKVDATLRRMSIIYNRVKNVFKQHFTRYSLLVQVIFCQINILCHQFTQTWPLILSDLQQFFTNCSEIQNLQNLCFEFQNNCVFVNLKKISRCILGYLVTKYVDLSKNNLYWLCSWSLIHKSKWNCM